MSDADHLSTNVVRAVARRGPDRDPASARRLAANRRNALKSTGPRTGEGKARSAQNARKSTGPRSPAGRAKAARNALRHGVWADEPIPRPDRRGFAAYVRHVAAEHELASPAEREWGLAFARAQWQLARLAEFQVDAAGRAARAAEGDGVNGDGGAYRLSADDLMRYMDAEARLAGRVLRLLRQRTRALGQAETSRRIGERKAPSSAGPARALAAVRSSAVVERSEPTAHSAPAERPER
jgi:hypothetical protein